MAIITIDHKYASTFHTKNQSQSFWFLVKSFHSAYWADWNLLPTGWSIAFMLAYHNIFRKRQSDFFSLCFFQTQCLLSITYQKSQSIKSVSLFIWSLNQYVSSLQLQPAKSKQQFKQENITEQNPLSLTPAFLSLCQSITLYLQQKQNNVHSLAWIAISVSVLIPSGVNLKAKYVLEMKSKVNKAAYRGVRYSIGWTQIKIFSKLISPEQSM